MAPTLNYGNTGSVHDASRCATYIVYSGGRWTPTYNGFYCP
jgi:hypothetical protein